MMASLQRLSLRSADELRLVKHIMIEFWMVSVHCWAFVQALSAGKCYGEYVRAQGPGHGKGPPHLHVSHALFSALQETVTQWIADNEMGVDTHTKWAAQEIANFQILVAKAGDDSKQQRLMLEMVKSCRVRESYTARKHKGRTQENQQEDQEDWTEEGEGLIEICINPNPDFRAALGKDADWAYLEELDKVSGLDFKRAVGALLMGVGGWKPNAQGPKTALERNVERNLQARRR